MPTTSPTTNLPLYQQIYDDIEQKISTGEIAYLEQLPILPALCRQYGVSEAPVRRALDELERGGYVSKQRGRGKGTFAIKRLATQRQTFRILTVGDADLQRSPIELVHEVFDIIAGIRDAARERGADAPLVSPAGQDALTRAEKGTGYLVIAQGRSGYEEGQKLAARHGAPCVLVNPPTGLAPCVRVDMEASAFLGVDYLARLGHRRIAYLGWTSGDWFQPRIDGYRRALAQNGLHFDAALVQISKGIDAKEDEDALDRLLALGDAAPTALFAASDYRALHVMARARSLGLAIPQGLSLCGYDDIGEAASVQPALTTVRHPRYELGRAAVDLLAALIAGDETTVRDVLIAPQLIERASTAPPNPHGWVPQKSVLEG